MSCLVIVGILLVKDDVVPTRPEGAPSYFNEKSVTVIDYNVKETPVSTPLASSLIDVPLEFASPARISVSYPGKRSFEGEYWSFEGEYWSATIRRHVPFESLHERLFATFADYRPDIVGISWQPFILKWPKGTPRHRGHVPDYFCRLSSGDGLVVDVKRPDKLDDYEKQFELTREVCDQVGWQYEVFSGLPDIFAQNLGFLAGFRQDRYSPALSIQDSLLSAFVPGTSLEVGIRRAARQTSLHQSLLRGNVLHLLWNHELSCDLSALLTDSTFISVAGNEVRL